MRSLLVAFAAVILLAGSIVAQVPQQLTRPTAASLISKSPWMSAHPYFTFGLGWTCVPQGNTARTLGANTRYAVMLEALSQSGLLQFREVDSKEWGNDSAFFQGLIECNIAMARWKDVSLTDRGREVAKASWPSVGNSISAPMGTRVFDAVTGITDGANVTKVAEFTWHWQAPAPADLFGLASRGPQTGAATFKLYDDGWRLLEVNSAGEELSVGPGNGVIFRDKPAVAAAQAHNTPDAPPRQSSGVTITVLKIAERMLGSDPVRVNTHFKPTTKALVAYLELKSSQAGEPIEVVWLAPDGTEKVRNKFESKPTPTNQSMWLVSRHAPTAGFAVGTWTVDVYVLGSRRTSTTFTIGAP